MRTKLLAFLAVLALIAVVLLYVREFNVLNNTIHAGRLVGGALGIGAAMSLGLIWIYRRRFQPWDRHRPEAFMLFFGLTLISPLLASLLNRSGGQTQYETFIFLEEKPHTVDRFDVLKGEEVTPDGYFLLVKDKQGNSFHFRYRKQAYFPFAKTGDEVLLPVHRGLLGFKTLKLE